MRKALIVEGGAMRGIFAAGVLDVFMEERFRPFDVAYGVSVGASNMLSYLAGQHGRARRCFLDPMSRREFIDGWRWMCGGHWMDLDWLWETIKRRDPLDVEGAAASGIDYRLVATCAKTGEPRYLRPGAHDMLDALKASCALPLLYRRTVFLGTDEFVDGGISDPLPVREAWSRGARRIMVIRSRAGTFVKKDSWINAFGAWQLGHAPAIARACRTAGQAYRAAVDFIHAPPAGCEIVHVAPVAPLATHRTTRDRDALERDYLLGRALGRRAILAWTRGAVAAARPQGARHAASIRATA
jgi:predicted patatin/cPLA2 family phospholipase